MTDIVIKDKSNEITMEDMECAIRLRNAHLPFYKKICMPKEEAMELWSFLGLKVKDENAD